MADSAIIKYQWIKIMEKMDKDIFLLFLSIDVFGCQVSLRDC